MPKRPKGKPPQEKWPNVPKVFFVALLFICLASIGFFATLLVGTIRRNTTAEAYGNLLQFGGVVLVAIAGGCVGSILLADKLRLDYRKLPKSKEKSTGIASFTAWRAVVIVLMVCGVLWLGVVSVSGISLIFGITAETAPATSNPLIMAEAITEDEQPPELPMESPPDYSAENLRFPQGFTTQEEYVEFYTAYLAYLDAQEKSINTFDYHSEEYAKYEELMAAGKDAYDEFEPRQHDGEWVRAQGADKLLESIDAFTDEDIPEWMQNGQSMLLRANSRHAYGLAQINHLEASKTDAFTTMTTTLDDFYVTVALWITEYRDEETLVDILESLSRAYSDIAYLNANSDEKAAQAEMISEAIARVAKNR